MTKIVYSDNLAGIQVGETRISNVDGEHGVLSYRGIAIDRLIERPFLQVVWLLLTGTEPDTQQETELQSLLATNSCLSNQELCMLCQLPPTMHPMLMLQCLVPSLDLTCDIEIPNLSRDAHQGLLIASKIPSLIAAKHQMELGNDPIKSNPHLSFHENFLTMFNARAPSTAETSVLDVTQILQLEHSFNASTFAGRVCASTLASIQSSLTASLATLSGKLHGGADQAALEMAMSIGSTDNAANYVAKCLQSKQKVMGMGHREYKVVDPRATILKPMAQSLCDDGEAKQFFETLVAVEAACQAEFSKSGKEIHANVEFYKGAVFYKLGIPTDYFTSLFAMARVFGYIAHFIEFSADSKLIRPSARYVGE